MDFWFKISFHKINIIYFELSNFVENYKKDELLNWEIA